MTKVKICGLTRAEDIQAVNRHLPEYAGFVFAPSRRRVTAEAARALIAELRASIMPVGVFVDEPPEAVAATAAFCGLGAVQLHGAEDGAYIARLRPLLPVGTLIIEAVRATGPEALAAAAKLPCDLPLLDAVHGGRFGGTGRAFDWSLMEGFERPYILAGGLHGGNVVEAVTRLRPYAVDVSTGVETDGGKDEQKIAEFITQARSVRP